MLRVYNKYKKQHHYIWWSILLVYAVIIILPVINSVRSGNILLQVTNVFNLLDIQVPNVVSITVDEQEHGRYFISAHYDSGLEYMKPKVNLSFKEVIIEHIQDNSHSIIAADKAIVSSRYDVIDLYNNVNINSSDKININSRHIRLYLSPFSIISEYLTTINTPSLNITSNDGITYQHDKQVINMHGKVLIND